MDQINPFFSIIGTLMVLLTLSVFFGMLLKISSVLIAILAFPVYLGLYYLELMLPLKSTKGERIFSLNIAKNNPAKIIMNLGASFVTLSLVSGVNEIWKALDSPSQQDQVELLYLTISGRLYPSYMIIIFFIGLVTIYLVSYFWAEKDENGTWTKIENLSIPSLWKTIAKNIQ